MDVLINHFPLSLPLFRRVNLLLCSSAVERSMPCLLLPSLHTYHTPTPGHVTWRKVQAYEDSLIISHL